LHLYERAGWRFNECFQVRMLFDKDTQMLLFVRLSHLAKHCDRDSLSCIRNPIRPGVDQCSYAWIADQIRIFSRVPFCGKEEVFQVIRSRKSHQAGMWLHSVVGSQDGERLSIE
jgi:hypothetical protein